MIKVPPLIVMDFETGGLDCNIHAVTEFAGIAINGETFEEIARYEAIVAPYSDELLYDPIALQKTGISMQQIKEGVSFKEFSKGVFDFFKKANLYTHPKYRPIITGHNIGFDAGFLQQIASFSKKKLEDYVSTYISYKGETQLSVFCTQMLAMIKYGNDPSMVRHQLIDCVHKIGEELVNAHRAMNDVEATVNLVIDYFTCLRNMGLNDNQIIQNVIGDNKQVSFRESFKF